MFSRTSAIFTVNRIGARYAESAMSSLNFVMAFHNHLVPQIPLPHFQRPRLESAYGEFKENSKTEGDRGHLTR